MACAANPASKIAAPCSVTDITRPRASLWRAGCIPPNNSGLPAAAAARTGSNSGRHRWSMSALVFQGVMCMRTSMASSGLLAQAQDLGCDALKRGLQFILVLGVNVHPHRLRGIINRIVVSNPVHAGLRDISHPDHEA